MAFDENIAIRSRIDRIRHLIQQGASTECYEAASLAQSVLHDTAGGNHPIMANLASALTSQNFVQALAATRSVVTLYDEGALRSPRLAIAHEIEGDILDIAQGQVEASERSTDQNYRNLQLAVAAFLAGASLEDALRRLCDARAIEYETQRTSLSKLQAGLYQPSKQIEVISKSENKQITAWGDTNKADHGQFNDITQSEVVAMVVGVRGFIDKYLP